MADVKANEVEVALPSLQEIIEWLRGDQYFTGSSERLVNVLGQLAAKLGGKKYTAMRIAEIVIRVAGKYAGTWAPMTHVAPVEEQALCAAQRWIPLLIEDAEVAARVISMLEQRRSELKESIIPKNEGGGS
jgi:hypothetical protein